MKTAAHTYKIEGKLKDKGFGFLCMQLASENGITGTLFYKSESNAILEANGDSKNINIMLNKCRQEDYITKIEILNTTFTDVTFNDFIILNQI